MADTKCTGDHSIHICEFAKQEKFEIVNDPAAELRGIKS
jgi:hypothetical protein